MQLLEYFMWIDQNCNLINKISTKIGFYQNLLQPIVSIIVAIYYTKKNLKKFHLFYITSIIYIFFVIPNLFINGYKMSNSCTKPCNNNRYGLSYKYIYLKFKNITWLLFLLALATPFSLMKKNGYKYIFLASLTYVIALFIDMFRKCNTGIPSAGSWWCLLGTTISLFAIFINKKK